MSPQGVGHLCPRRQLSPPGDPDHRWRAEGIVIQPLSGCRCPALWTRPCPPPTRLLPFPHGVVRRLTLTLRLPPESLPPTGLAPDRRAQGVGNQITLASANTSTHEGSRTSFAGFAVSNAVSVTVAADPVWQVANGSNEGIITLIPPPASLMPAAEENALVIGS